MTKEINSYTAFFICFVIFFIILCCMCKCFPNNASEIKIKPYAIHELGNNQYLLIGDSSLEGSDVVKYIHYLEKKGYNITIVSVSDGGMTMLIKTDKLIK